METVTVSPKPIRIAIIGDFNPASPTHVPPNDALTHAAAALDQQRVDAARPGWTRVGARTRSRRRTGDRATLGARR